MALNAATAAAAEAEAARLAAAMSLCHNPMLLLQPPAQAPQPMPRCVYQLCRLAPGDDAFWFNAATGDSQWELPVGADSACGWIYASSALGVGGAWRHSVTGAVESSARAVRKACRVLECFAAPARVQALECQSVLAETAAVEEAGAREELPTLQEVQAEVHAAQEEEVEAQEEEVEAQDEVLDAQDEEWEAQEEMVEEEEAAAPASRAFFAASLAASSYYSEWRAEKDTADEQRVAARRRNPGIRDLQRQLQQQLRVAWDPLCAAPPGASRKIEGPAVSQASGLIGGRPEGGAAT